MCTADVIQGSVYQHKMTGTLVVVDRVTFGPLVSLRPLGVLRSDEWNLDMSDFLTNYEMVSQPERTPRECDACQLLETAWGLIANVSGGDWNKETEEWRVTAERWRDEYTKVRRDAAGI